MHIIVYNYIGSWRLCTTTILRGAHHDMNCTSLYSYNCTMHIIVYNYIGSWRLCTTTILRAGTQRYELCIIIFI